MMDDVASSKLERIPPHLRIRVLHHDESIVVIEKPGNLRSVPGNAATVHVPHAKRPPKRPRVATLESDGPSDKTMERYTAQEAWILAIRSLQNDPVQDDGGRVPKCLQALATSTNISSVPRKWKGFQKYLQKNALRLWGQKIRNQDIESFLVDFRKVYDVIEKRQHPLLNLSERTRHEDSAFGQLILMGYEEEDEDSFIPSREKGLFVVHRLDCETSGVMVFARNNVSASKLSRCWRERENVKKEYLARVRVWPPYHNDKQTEGRIDVPLAPSEERIKWQVHANGKESVTLWKVLDQQEGTVILSLTPITGRTHQLRIHCDHVGIGIEGDSLYGENRIEGRTEIGDGCLYLHAYKLSFPHPHSGEQMEFVASPSWWAPQPESAPSTSP